MSYLAQPSNFRVDHSYENEFALAASAEVVAVVAFGLLLTSIMPDLPWAIVSTTTGADAPNASYPITNEQWSLWTNSCNTAGMAYTYNSGLCQSRYQVIQAFSTLATMFSLLGVIFGVMPFSPVAPREPKQALTHSMLSHMAAGVFALISWSTFYGGLVFGVWQSPNTAIVFGNSSWKNNVIVTYGGIVAVSGWCASFCAWVLSLSAMIKYDSAAAEQAIIDHKQKKEDKRRRKAELIERLGEGAARAAREGIALELGDKLYLGGTVAAGATSAIAWMNNCVTPYLLHSPNALPVSAGAAMIVNVGGTTIGAIVLLIGLSDLVPRPKASVGGFSVFATSTVIFICSLGMATSYLRSGNKILLSFEAAVGTIGVGFALATTIVLYHPFKIWEKIMEELPRPAKIHKGKNGLALAVTAAVSCLIGFGLSCGAVTIYMLNAEEFLGRAPTRAPTMAPSVGVNGSQTCPNVLGDLCYVGPPEDQCCQPPLICTETSFTRFTCEYPNQNILVGLRDSYSVAQAFLALFIGAATIAYVFAAIALTPNGVMDIKVALSVTFSMAIVASACGLVTFAVLQGYILSAGLSGMPRECGYILGGFFAEMVAAGCGFFAWLPYHATNTITQEDELWESQRALEIEQIRLETVKLRSERLRLEADLGELTGGNGPERDRIGGKRDATGEHEEEKSSDSPNMNTAMDLQAV